MVPIQKSYKRNRFRCFASLGKPGTIEVTTMTLVLKLALLVTILINSLVSSEIKCPNKCKCMDTVVRCMFAQLDKVPSVPLDTTVLDLRFNKIQHIGVNAFKRLKNLNTLLLNNNHVNHLKNGVFNGLTGLKYLYLYKNRIKEIDSDALHPLENLEQLYLHFNKIESLPKGVFRSLKKLNRLFLHNNKLQRIPSEAFQNLHEIKRLRLDSNALICDCQLIWLAKMLQDKRQETQSAVTCHDPAPMQGKPVTHLLEDEGFHCRFGIDSANQEHNKLSIIGENTRPVDPKNKYPWMAALMRVVGNSEEPFCGGSVVHEKHVVTAAHCVKDIDPVDPPRNRIFVRLGEYQLSIRTGNEQDFKVDKIMIHERYFNNISSGDNNNTCDRDYDIAILRLSQPADLEYFPRIYLPMDEETSGIDGEKATVIGWGITDIERYKTIYNTSDILLQNEVHIMTSENCKRHYYWYERAMMICTKPTAGDGDSGGPLMIKKKHDFLLKSEEKYWLIGIVSYDYGCRKSNESEFSEVSIFVRTSYFTRWIYEKLLWG